jgi:multicomponent Na+:H+ antiporter subunit D
MTVASLVVLVPFVLACLLACVAPFARRRAGVIAVAGAAATLVLASLVLADDADRLIVWFGGWTPRDGVAIGVSFTIDTLGAGMAVFIAGLGVAALVVASRMIVEESFLFDALVLVFLGAMLVFTLTGDLFNLFVALELMSVAAYVLVGYEVRHRAALEGSLTFAISSSVGSLLLLFGIGLLYGRTGALNLAHLGRALAHGPHDTLVVVAFALVMSGLLVKAAVVPFHLWTADAYAVAPTPICILLAGAFSELGLYGVARVYWAAFDGALGAHAAELRAVLIVAGLLTGLIGAVMCAAQHHLKRMLAFATIAQVGLFLVGVGALTADGLGGAAVWVVGDGLVKAALFTSVAILQYRYDAAQEQDLFGRARELWPLGVLFALGALMVASLPLTGPFLGKALVEDALLKLGGYDWVPAVMLVVTGLVGGTLLRVAARVFGGFGEPPPADPAGDEAEEESPDREQGGHSVVLWGAAVLLTLAAVAWGIVPGVADAAATAAAAFVDQPGYVAAVMDGHTPAVATHAVSGPGVTAYLYAAGSLALAVAVATAALARPLPAGAARAVDALRAIHDGRPGDYVAWTVGGAALLGAVFAITLQ